MKITTMATAHTYSFRNQQRGAATIIMALIMLFSITIVSIFTARTTITEQKISGNEFRGKQAFEAAEAGLQFGVAYFENGGADHTSPANGVDEFSTTNIDGATYEPGQASYHVAFCDPDIATHTPPSCRNDLTTSISTCTAPPDNSIALVYACGWSDDRSATRTISQIVRFKPALPNIPKAPFINRGHTDITGNLVVRNNFTNTTVWTGGNVENIRARQSRHGHSRSYLNQNSGNFITEIKVGDERNTPSTSTNNGNIDKGPDVIANDPYLSNSSPDTYFQNFFGISKAYVQGNVDLVINDGGAMPPFEDSLNKLIYATGAITVNDELGLAAQPVVLVVNGTLTLTGNSTIYGAVYAVDVKTGNDATINGALIVENSTTINDGDNLIINYDTDVLDATQKIGMTGAVSGSWHDW